MENRDVRRRDKFKHLTPDSYTKCTPDSTICHLDRSIRPRPSSMDGRVSLRARNCQSASSADNWQQIMKANSLRANRPALVSLLLLSDRITRDLYSLTCAAQTTQVPSSQWKPRQRTGIVEKGRSEETTRQKTKLQLRATTCNYGLFPDQANPSDSSCEMLTFSRG